MHNALNGLHTVWGVGALATFLLWRWWYPATLVQCHLILILFSLKQLLILTLLLCWEENSTSSCIISLGLISNYIHRVNILVYSVDRSSRIRAFIPGRIELIHIGILRLQLSSDARAAVTPVGQREPMRALEWLLDLLLIWEGSGVPPLFSKALSMALLGPQDTGNKHSVHSLINKCKCVSCTCVFIYILCFHPAHVGMCS